MSFVPFMLFLFRLLESQPDIGMMRATPGLSCAPDHALNNRSSRLTVAVW
jgi:hypothetical protein